MDIMETNETEKKKTDRYLGDEWENWTGELDESKTYNEKSGLFAVFSVFAMAVFFGIIAVSLYMIEPRLYMISPVLLKVVLASAVVFAAGCGIWFLLIIISVQTGKNLFFSLRFGQITASKILPSAMALARRLGISRDRIGKSFVVFSNTIVSISYKTYSGKTIIILPRCLRPEIKTQVQEIAGQADIKVFTATGGGQARKIVRDERPHAVIAVACERDLMSGINDVVPKLTAFGITNIRPEGPCKNTELDIGDLKKAIKTLTGVTVD